MQKNLNDEEIVVEIKNGNIDILSILITKYSNYSYSLACSVLSHFKFCGVNSEELMLVGIEIIPTVVQKFKTGEKTFYPYWKKIAERKMREYIFENSYFFGAKTFNGISLDSLIDGNDDLTPLADALGEDDHSIKHAIISGEIHEIIKDKKTGLSSDEKRVMKLLMRGFTSEMISKCLNIKITKTYNLKRRAKDKIAKAILNKQ